MRWVYCKTVYNDLVRVSCAQVISAASGSRRLDFYIARAGRINLHVEEARDILRKLDGKELEFLNRR